MQRALDDTRDRAPADFELRWEERGGAALGAREIVVTGDGRAVRRVWRPGFAADPSLEGTPNDDAADTSSYQLDEGSVVSLMRLVRDIRGWTQEADDDLPDPGLSRARAWLKLRVGDARSEIWEEHADLEATGRLSRVRDALESMLRAAPRTDEPPEAAPEPIEEPAEEEPVLRLELQGS